MKWILRYLKGSSDMALCYGGTNVQLLRYVDSNFTGDVDSRRNITGYIFNLESEAIIWVSGLQKIVVLSMMDAEYVAMTEVFKELIWLIFLKESGKSRKLHQCTVTTRA